MTTSIVRILGPVLFLDQIAADGLHLSALFIAPKGVAVPDLHTDDAVVPVRRIASFDDLDVHRARFVLPPSRAAYHWNGTAFEVQGAISADMRIAYVSCNGEEIGDLEREGSERNLMWDRLCEDHRIAPFSLLLHGGDQVYADEATDGHPLSDDWPDAIPRDPRPEELAGLRHHLRERFVERYATLYASPPFAWIAARVPSLMQWDDHDICDGWGSLAPSATQSAVGRTIFDVARESFLIFQAATTEGDLPARFADPQGRHLGWAVRGGNIRIVAPDLRSQRTRKRVMGPEGWAFMEDQRQMVPDERCILMSSVPLLGPRLSLFETAMRMVPRMQRFEDDLRDQWQSHAHREEWRRMLQAMVTAGESSAQDVIVVSGEIHLASRAEMSLGAGRMLHQLVASGIAHRAPPKAWARLLDMLARLGDSPLSGHPIRIARIPGQRGRYAAERNYLVLNRDRSGWQAQWHLESSGVSAPLPV